MNAIRLVYWTLLCVLAQVMALFLVVVVYVFPDPNVPHFLGLLIGPMCGLGLLTAYGVLRDAHSDVWTNAVAFAEFGVAMMLALYMNLCAPGDAAERPLLSAGPWETPAEAWSVLLLVAGILTALNLVIAWSVGRPPPPARGTAFTQPSGLWVTWVGYLAVGLGGLGTVAWVSPDPRWWLFVPFLVLRVHYAWFAMGAAREWHWSSLAKIMATKEGLVAGAALATVLSDGSAPHHPDAWVVGLVGVISVVFAYRFQSLGAAPSAHAASIGEGPDGWVLMDLLNGPSMVIQGLLTGRRPTHLCGVGAAGALVLGDLHEVTKMAGEHEFFVPGRTWPVTMRFSNVTYEDDAAVDVRGASLRLAPPELLSPFDMMMNTGNRAAFANVVQFGAIVFSKFLPDRLVLAMLPRDQTGWEGAFIGWRLAPDSYYGLRFYSAMSRHWISRDGQIRLVRYRLVPADDTPESGLLTVPDMRENRARRKGDTRPPDYLRREFQQRLATQVLHFRLEVQLHVQQNGDGLTWYDATIEWPENTHPWMGLGVVTLERALPFEVTEALEFSPGNHPPSLPVPVADGPFDPRSLADSERRVVTRIQAIRRWQRRVLGFPNPIGKVS